MKLSHLPWPQHPSPSSPSHSPGTWHCLPCLLLPEGHFLPRCCLALTPLTVLSLLVFSKSSH